MKKLYKWMVGMFMGVSIMSTVCAAEEVFSDYQNEYEDSYVIFQGETIDIEAEPVITEKGMVTDDEPVWEYAFTAPRDGLYYVGIENIRENAEVNFEFADAWDNKATLYQNWDTFNAKEGDLYTFSVSKYRGNTDFDFTLIMQQPSAEIGADVTKVNDSNSFSGQLNNYIYKAPENGVYHFEVNCEAANAKTTTYIYSSDGSRINNSYSENSYKQNIALNKGEIYTISVEETVGFGPYSVMIGVPQTITDISGYSSVKDKFEYSSQINYYAFTAPVDGSYRWGYETASGDVLDEIYMYNEDWSIKEDFDTNPYGARSQIIEMKAGETYYLTVENYYSVYYIGEYTLHIAYPEGMETNLVVTDNAKASSEPGIDDGSNSASEDVAEYETEKKPTMSLEEENEMLKRILEENGIEISDLVG